MRHIIEAKNNKAPISKLATRAAGAVLMAGVAVGCGSSSHGTAEAPPSGTTGGNHQNNASTPAVSPSTPAPESGKTVKKDLCAAIPAGELLRILNEEGFDDQVTTTGCQLDNTNANQLASTVFFDNDDAHFYAGESGAAELGASVRSNEKAGPGAIEYYEHNAGTETTSVEGNPAVYAEGNGILYVDADGYFFTIQVATTGDAAAQEQLSIELAEVILKYGFD